MIYIFFKKFICSKKKKMKNGYSFEFDDEYIKEIQIMRVEIR